MEQASDRDALVSGFEAARGEPAPARVREELGALSWSDAPWLDAGVLGAELARCLEDREADEVPTAIAELHLDDLVLALGARRGEASAVRAFEKRCIDPLGPTIGRVDASATFVDEIRQRVRAKLLVAEPGKPAKLGLYRGRGELATWVRVVAAREALSAARGDRRAPSELDDELSALEASTTGPELGAVKEQYREAFAGAFRAAIGELTPEQRNVLRLHYLHGLTVDDLGGLLKVHRSNAARRVAKARRELLAGTRRRLLIELEIGREDFDDLMRLIASRIDVSIERHLAD